MKRPFDHRIGGDVVPSLEADGLQAWRAIVEVVPPVVPRHGDRPRHRRRGVLCVLGDRVPHGVDDERVDRTASKHVGPLVEARPGLEGKPSLRKECRTRDLLIDGTQLPVAVDVGDIGREQDGFLLRTEARRGGRGGGGRGGGKKPPTGRARRVACRSLHLRTNLTKDQGCGGNAADVQREDTIRSRHSVPRVAYPAAPSHRRDRHLIHCWGAPSGGVGDGHGLSTVVT